MSPEPEERRGGVAGGGIQIKGEMETDDNMDARVVTKEKQTNPDLMQALKGLLNWIGSNFQAGLSRCLHTGTPSGDLKIGACYVMVWVGFLTLPQSVLGMGELALAGASAGIGGV